MKLEEYLLTDDLKDLLVSFCELNGFTVGITDLEGNTLFSMEWAPACKNFHRVNPLTQARCVASDINVSDHLTREGEYHIFQCPNGLFEAGVPIVIDNNHVANLVLGQFFLEQPETNIFARQAADVGFERDSYIAAIRAVPVFTREFIEKSMEFFCKLAKTMGQQGLQQLRLKQKNKELSELQRSMQSTSDFIEFATTSTRVGLFRFCPRTGEVVANRMYRTFYGLDNDEKIHSFDHVIKHIPEDEVPNFVAFLKSVNKHSGLMRTVHRTGTDLGVRWVSAEVRPAYENGELFFYGAIKDIDDIRRSEVELDYLKRRAELATKTLGFGLVDCYSNRPDIQMDESVREIFKLPDDQPIIGTFAKFLRERVVPEHREQLDALFQYVIETNEQRQFEFEVIDLDNNRKWVEGVLTVAESDQSVKHLLVILSDCTERKQALAEVAKSHSENQSLAEMLELATTEADIRITEENLTQAISRFICQGKAEVPRPPALRDRLKVALPEDRETIEKIYQNVGYSGVYASRSAQDPDKLIWLKHRLLQRYKNGPDEYAVSLVMNVTEEKTLQLELEQLATLDALTNVANRRKFDEFIQTQFHLSHRNNEPISIIMMDIDHFKSFNDRYGHLQGDNCLKQVAAALKNQVHRPTDLIARYGGEEFVAVLPETDSDGAQHIADIIRQAVEDLDIPNEDSKYGKVTLSLGGVSMVPKSTDTIEQLIHLADSALYRAKEAGRNLICF